MDIIRELKKLGFSSEERGQMLVRISRMPKGEREKYLDSLKTEREEAERKEKEKVRVESQITYSEDEADFGNDMDMPADGITTDEYFTDEEGCQEETDRTMEYDGNLSEYEGEDEDDMAEKARAVDILVIMDGTPSFSVIFPEIYRVLCEFVRRTAEMKREVPDVAVRYGLLVFGGPGEDFRKAVNRAKDSYFTEDADLFLEWVKEIEFKGGAADGKEDVNGAIEEGIRMLETGSGETDNLGIVLFTDSLPDDLKPRFDAVRTENRMHRGLRFANIYAYSDRYLPVFKIVDRDGNVTEGEKNVGGKVTGIRALLEPNGSQVIKNTVAEVMRQASVIK